VGAGKGKNRRASASIASPAPVAFSYYGDRKSKLADAAGVRINEGRWNRFLDSSDLRRVTLMTYYNTRGLPATEGLILAMRNLLNDLVATQSIALPEGTVVEDFSLRYDAADDAIWLSGEDKSGRTQDTRVIAEITKGWAKTRVTFESEGVLAIVGNITESVCRVITGNPYNTT
jgi:hypothetical protein